MIACVRACVRGSRRGGRSRSGKTKVGSMHATAAIEEIEIKQIQLAGKGRGGSKYREDSGAVDGKYSIV